MASAAAPGEPRAGAFPGLGDATHEVLNQPPELAGYNAFISDAALAETVTRHGAGWAVPHLREVGATVGSARVQTLARQANRFPPELRTHDRFGRRIDEIEFHPAWHELMRLCFGQGTHSLAWTEEGRPGAQVARAAVSYLWSQGESGVGCPAAMTFASVPVFRHQPELWAAWRDRVLSTRYDPAQGPAESKTGATIAMALTEKQGGSDLRATQTVAVPADGGEHRITGHKWFFSVPQSDAFFTLARTGAGIGCFLVPGWRPDGSRNGVLAQRLKDKCGNRSNASAEIELRGARGRMVGEDGRGIATLLEMAQLTRVECALGSAGLMRRAASQALHHCAHRRAFGKALIDQPLMRNVLADLALEAEAAMALAFRVAAALDAAASDPAEALFARIAAPVAKYWVCRRAPAVAAEALECHGGNGFIEEHEMARLYRDAPLNGIWEGSGNVICLDVLRALGRDPRCAAAFLDEIARARGGDRRLDLLVGRLRSELAGRDAIEFRARAAVEAMATALQASLLLRFAPTSVAEAFCAGRLGGEAAGARAFGTLPAGVDPGPVLERARAA